ncbi:aldose epimerase family protein [Actibacterium pelagium]|nr:aldose epimerase family protein [Actibacterium pelagium]
MPDGQTIDRVTLQGGGLTASVITYGAVLQDLRLDGHDAPLVLGFPEFAPYLIHSPHFGATAGRYANRIRDGHLELDGTTYQLDRNFLGKHHLHGGSKGTGKQVWKFQDHSASHATLRLDLPDGHMGFPGDLTVEVTFALETDGVLDIRIIATTDAPTLCNFAHHSYFTLDSEASASEHLLTVAADHYLPVDAELIPTGEIRPVEGTPFDFTTPAPIVQAFPIDHNFCLSNSRTELRTVATLQSLASGVTMECRTTEPGLQIYDGAKINIPLIGLHGQPMSACAGIAMEPQVWPDANHHDGFPLAVLRPGETYEQHTQYVFSRTTT